MKSCFYMRYYGSIWLFEFKQWYIFKKWTICLHSSHLEPVQAFNSKGFMKLHINNFSLSFQIESSVDFKWLRLPERRLQPECRLLSGELTAHSRAGAGKRKVRERRDAGVHVGRDREKGGTDLGRVHWERGLEQGAQGLRRVPTGQGESGGWVLWVCVVQGNLFHCTLLFLFCEVPNFTFDVFVCMSVNLWYLHKLE